MRCKPLCLFHTFHKVPLASCQAVIPCSALIGLGAGAQAASSHTQPLTYCSVYSYMHSAVGEARAAGDAPHTAPLGEPRRQDVLPSTGSVACSPLSLGPSCAGGLLSADWAASALPCSFPPATRHAHHKSSQNPLKMNLILTPLRFDLCVLSCISIAWIACGAWLCLVA